VTKEKVSFSQIVEDFIRRRFAKQAKPVSYDTTSVGESIWRECIHLFILMTKDTLGDAFSRRDALSWCESFITLGQFDIFLSDLKKLDKVMLHSLHLETHEILRNYREFKVSACECTRIALGRITWLIELVARFDRTSVSQLHQLCSFGERVTVPDYPNAESNAIAKWKSAYEFTSTQTQLATQSMKESVQRLFDKYSFWSYFSPTHSNGSVVEHYPYIERKSVHWRRLTRYQKFLITNGRVARYMLRKAGLPALPTPMIKEPPIRHTFQMYVPKGVDSRRIVESESAELVFCQHGVAAALN
jgi:hypothetical protein